MTIWTRFAGCVCVLVLASALATVAAGALNTPQPAWFLIMFELVIAAGCGWAAATTLPGGPAGREHVAITLVCVALCVFVGSVLGYLSVNGRVWNIGLRSHLLTRVAAAGLIGAAAAWETLRYDATRAVRRLAVGCVLIVPALAAAALVYQGVGMGRVAALPAPVRVSGACVAFVVWCGLLAAGAHQVFAAFEGAMAARRREGEPATRAN